MTTSGRASRSLALMGPRACSIHAAPVSHRLGDDMTRQNTFRGVPVAAVACHPQHRSIVNTMVDSRLPMVPGSVAPKLFPSHTSSEGTAS
jgi:hypothetical protein